MLLIFILENVVVLEIAAYRIKGKISYHHEPQEIKSFEMALCAYFSEVQSDIDQIII